MTPNLIRESCRTKQTGLNCKNYLYSTCARGSIACKFEHKSVGHVADLYCNICLDKIVEDNLFTLTTCSHAMCGNCVKKLEDDRIVTGKICPYCRGVGLPFKLIQGKVFFFNLVIGCCNVKFYKYQHLVTCSKLQISFYRSNLLQTQVYMPRLPGHRMPQKKLQIRTPVLGMFVFPSDWLLRICRKLPVFSFDSCRRTNKFRTRKIKTDSSRRIHAAWRLVNADIYVVCGHKKLKVLILGKKNPFPF